MFKKKEVKMYAIQLEAEETIKKVKALKKLCLRTESVGVLPDYPYIYVLFDSSKKRDKAFYKFYIRFVHCKKIVNPCFVPETK